ncbi:right-handed parallel beta-helix repeat-containing protein [Halobellus ruber]|uniref:Right-handed parallel beta-helix repeat-containing protein n=1 Tax=Halobellus ruber TaxID=2761102 RepID=A0A7J9SKV3_9EURY|nr:right-handed parallel beta-helix repeat-containing protein [Halobellus ruber]MBB6646637.1 right-handed parallel beta-helix repeat-containing protein [Halobellus ruber]
MNRRKFLATLGAATAGTSGVVGTGAFTSVSADRSISVAVADDADAFLAMTPSDGPNGEFAETTGDGTIALALTDTDAGGSGVGTDSIYEFDDVFRIANQGTQTVYVWATLSGGSQFDDDTLYFYPNGARSTPLNDGAGSGDEVLGLAPGESAEIGVHIDTGSVPTGSDSITATVRADVDEGPSDGSDSVDLEGEEFIVVAQDGSGDFTSIRNAIDSVSGSTIVVESGTYDTEAELGSFGSNIGLQIGSQDAGTDPASAPVGGLRLIGRGQPTIGGWVQILDPGITFEGFEVTGEVFNYGLAAFEPGVTIRNVTVSGVTNGLFVPSAEDVRVEDCTVENYSFYGAVVSGRGEFGGATPTITGTTFDGASGGGAVGVGIVETAAEVRESVVTGNEFTGDDGAGIAHFSGANAAIQENTVENNDDGVFLAGPDAGTVTATRNDIVNNRVGVANEASSGSTPVDATGNWWGSADGPGASASTNTIGTQGPVDSDPWSTAPGPNWNADGMSAGISSFSVETGGGESNWEGPKPPEGPDRAD